MGSVQGLFRDLCMNFFGSTVIRKITGVNSLRFPWIANA